MNAHDNMYFVLCALLVYVLAMILAKVAGDNELSSCLAILGILMAVCSMLWAFSAMIGWL